MCKPLIVLVILFAGCDRSSSVLLLDNSGVEPDSTATGGPTTTTAAPVKPHNRGELDMLAKADKAKGEGEAPAKLPAGGGEVANAPQTVQRKLIYTAGVELVVDDLGGKSDDVQQLVKKFGGDIANSSVESQSGGYRSARWKLRVPVEKFDAFMQAVRGLGEVARVTTNSQEVTEEYYDVEARIKAKQLERQRLEQLLADKDRVAKLSDLLEVERELARVQGELEQFQGRQRVLNDLTSLTTIDLQIRQIRNYTPPEAATFSTRAARTLSYSLRTMSRAGQGLVLAAIAAIPWLILLLVVVGGAFMVWRRRRARRRVVATVA